MREIPDGIISMMVTPMYDKDDENQEYEREDVNFPAFYREMDWCSEHGAQGVVVTPSIGEFATLIEHERLECFETCGEYLQKELPHIFRIAGIAATSTGLAKFYAEYARDCGFEAGQINPPYYWVPGEEALYRHYCEVAKVGLPLVVYNNPRLSKFDIKPKFAARLAQIPGVIAIKEVKTDPHNDLEPLFERVREANPSVKMYTTYRAFLYGIILGCNGAFANVQTTQFCRKMWDLAREDPIWTKGNLARIRAIHKKQNEVFPRGGEDNPYHVATTKLFAELTTGIKMGNAREPDAFPPDFPVQNIIQRFHEKYPALLELIK